MDPGALSFVREARRRAVAASPSHVGLDFARLHPGSEEAWKLELCFIPSAVKAKSLRRLTRANLAIRHGGEPASAFEIVRIGEPQAGGWTVPVWLRPTQPSGPLLEDALGELTVDLFDVPDLDPFFSRATVRLGVDPAPAPQPPEGMPAVPDADSPSDFSYLAKDYRSFRQLMLDRMKLLVPGWTERNPADLGVAVIEALAYAADYQSYYQDAVATEAYLATARRRLSVRRHARLLDYRLQEGRTSRVWVEVRVAVSPEDPRGYLPLPLGTEILTRCGQLPPVLPLASNDYRVALEAGSLVFETLEARRLYPQHNELRFYTWGATEFYLAPGSTRAVLDGALPHLEAGQVLILEEVLGPHTGRPADADPRHRHAVRLSAPPRPGKDDLYGRELTEIEWHIEDALPFALTVSTLVDGRPVAPVSVARGNVVLADFGRTVGETLPRVPTAGRYQPRLERTDLSFQQPFDRRLANRISATASMRGDSSPALPDIVLFELDEPATEPPAPLPRRPSDLESRLWRAREDLLNSSRFARDFVVEVEEDRSAWLRFGDGRLGKVPPPGTCFQAVYRVGNGARGNVGSETLVHLATERTELLEPERILAVRNPLGAVGGSDPESLEDARIFAPLAYRTQERCVTREDFEAIARRHPWVADAAAVLRWTGSWNTAFLHVQLVDGRPLDAAAREDIRIFMEPFVLAVNDLAVRPPQPVPLAIGLTVTVEPTYFRHVIRRRLEEAFSDRRLADGRKGFFYPDNFGFGDPVELDALLDRAAEVSGVAAVRADLFRRRDDPAGDARNRGRIVVGALEIAQVRGNRARPQLGFVTFTLEGGQ